MSERQYLIEAVSADFRKGVGWNVLVVPLDNVCCEPKKIAQFASNDDANLFVAAKTGETK